MSSNLSRTAAALSRHQYADTDAALAALTSRAVMNAADPTHVAVLMIRAVLAGSRRRSAGSWDDIAEGALAHLTQLDPVTWFEVRGVLLRDLGDRPAAAAMHRWLEALVFTVDERRLLVDVELARMSAGR